LVFISFYPQVVDFFKSHAVRAAARYCAADVQTAQDIVIFSLLKVWRNIGNQGSGLAKIMIVSRAAKLRIYNFTVNERNSYISDQGVPACPN